MRKKIILSGLAFALGEAAYISLIALVPIYANKYFGEGPSGPNMLGIMTFLLIFVLSAAVSGALVLGKPILLYLENRKREAVGLFISTLGWIFILLVVLFIFLLARR